MLHHVIKPPRRSADLPIFLAQLRKQETMLRFSLPPLLPFPPCGLVVLIQTKIRPKTSRWLFYSSEAAWLMLPQIERQD